MCPPLLQVDSEPQGVPRVASAQSTGSGDAADGSLAGSAAADARVRFVSVLTQCKLLFPCSFSMLLAGSTLPGSNNSRLAHSERSVPLKRASGAVLCQWGRQCS